MSRFIELQTETLPQMEFYGDIGLKEVIATSFGRGLWLEKAIYGDPSIFAKSSMVSEFNKLVGVLDNWERYDDEVLFKSIARTAVLCIARPKGMFQLEKGQFETEHISCSHYGQRNGEHGLKGPDAMWWVKAFGGYEITLKKTNDLVYSGGLEWSYSDFIGKCGSASRKFERIFDEKCFYPGPWIKDFAAAIFQIAETMVAAHDEDNLAREQRKQENAKRWELEQVQRKERDASTQAAVVVQDQAKRRRVRDYTP